MSRTPMSRTSRTTISRTAGTKSRVDLAALRHELLTPLNHLIGFSEMLLEETRPDGFDSVAQHLTRIREIAKELARMVQTTAVPGTGKSSAKLVEELRYQLSGPLHTILQAVGAITSEFTEELNVSDILKIGAAASELLAFTQGHALAKPGVVPAHRMGLNRRSPKRSPISGRILVVDDNETSRGLLSRHLTRQGHEVTQVSSGMEALAVLVESRFDVVLLDVLMPKLDGFQVLEKIKADPATMDIPVIVVSALDEIPGMVRCIEIGAEDYLFKPFDPVLLAARIDSCLEKKRFHDLEKQRALDLEKAYEQVHLSEERLKLALKTDHARIWDRDLTTDKVVLFGELNQLFDGYERSLDEYERSFEDVMSRVHPDDKERISQRVREAIERRTNFHEEFRILHPGGITFWAESMATVCCNEDGHPTRMIGLTRDITQRKQLEEALQTSNQDFERFALAASHDLQEPLRDVSKNLEKLLARTGPSIDTEEQRVIRSSVTTLSRMSDLIRDLLDYSQASVKRGEAQTTSADAVLSLVLTDLKTAIEQSGGMVTRDHLPVVQGDFRMLQRVFQNLISNAIKYRAADAPRIHISAERRNDWWVFSVADNGIGIDPKHNDSIFGTFGAAGSEAARSGLGLAMCQRIVDHLGGEIWLESDVGKGSTFYFTIPAHDD